LIEIENSQYGFTNVLEQISTANHSIRLMQHSLVRAVETSISYGTGTIQSGEGENPANSVVIQERH